MAASLVDIDKPGKYPIVLSDALLGKTSKEVYTGIRYNHKPDLSSNSSQSSIQIQPSDSDPASYDLSLSDNSDEYSYTGARTSSNGQYVLLFDAPNKRFVLHRIDSTFDMNLVKAPWEDDASTLRSQYTQLDTPARTKATQPPQRKALKSTKNVTVAKTEQKRRKSVEKPRKSKPPPRDPSPEEEEDSDDGLTIEYPDGPSNSHSYNAQPTPVFQHLISEEVSDEDAEGEEYEDERNQDVDLLKLPGPANNRDLMSDEDLELDLEAELEEALKSPAETGAGESDESEEE